MQVVRIVSRAVSFILNVKTTNQCIVVMFVLWGLTPRHGQESTAELVLSRIEFVLRGVVLVLCLNDALDRADAHRNNGFVWRALYKAKRERVSEGDRETHRRCGKSNYFG